MLYNDNGLARIDYFANVDLTESKINRRYTTCYRVLVFVGGNLVSWKINRAWWLDLLWNQSVVLWHNLSVYIISWKKSCWNWYYQLNLSVIIKLFFISPRICCHERTKHIEVDYQFVREKIRANMIYIEYMKKYKQSTNLFVKTLRENRVEHLYNKLAMINIYAQNWERMLWFIYCYFIKSFLVRIFL